MTMNARECQQIEALANRLGESDTPNKGNLVVFYDEQDRMLYSGIVAEWPTIIATDIEWGEVKELDATKEPFAGKRVRFFDPITGHAN